jgi:CrcB protein
MNPFLAVFIGGGFGSLARYSLSLWIKTLTATQLPIATLGANMLSTIVLAVAFFTLKPTTPAWIYTLIGIGFCGGFSTFSTFSLETFQLLKTGQIAWAVANVLVSISLCLLILFLFSKTIK